MLTALRIASCCRQRIMLAASARSGICITRQSKTGSREARARSSALPLFRSASRKAAVAIAASTDVIFWTRPSNSTVLSGVSACQSRLISSDWV